MNPCQASLSVVSLTYGHEKNGKGSLQSERRLAFGALFLWGGNKAALAEMSHARSQLGSTWFVFQAFIF